MESHGKSEPIIDVDIETNDEPVIDVDEENAVKENRGGVKRSFVGDHFTYVKGSNKTKVKCDYCLRIMAAGTKANGTSSMRYHLLSVCKRSPRYLKHDMKKQSILGYKPSALGGVGGSLAPFSFSQENTKKCLAQMCIIDNKPFSIVEYEGLKKFAWSLNPMFKFPSRCTITRDCLSIYQEEKNKLKQLFKNQTVSLTTDTWTSVQNFNYMCLTAHWVDENFILRKKIINFCQIANHKGETIGRLVYHCLKEWGIDRVFTITVDNAASNDGTIKYLKSMLNGPNGILDCKYLHLRCCAHIINLVVRDGLDEQFDTITRIRNAVKYVRSSPSRYASFLECVESEKVGSKNKPCLDVETRWNSTFIMLETAEKYSKVFDRLRVIDTNYKSYFRKEVDEQNCNTSNLESSKQDGESSTKTKKKNEKALGPPTHEDWEIARNFMEYLNIFYKVTKKVSGNNYVTSNLFVGELVKMHVAISSICSNKDGKKRKMALSMKAKYDKYWDNIDNMNFMLYVALILDPRNKLFFLGYCLELIYGDDKVKIDEVTERVKKILKELYDYYKKNVDGEKETNISGFSSSTVGVTSVEDLDIDAGYEKYLETRGVGVHDTEWEIYLNDGTEKKIKGDDTFDVLGWWKLNSVKFPVLSLVAKHVLAMPISTVASESAFSTGGRVIDKFRISLTPQTSKALICSQDWLRSTSADLQEMILNGLPLEDLTENLEKLEIELLLKGKKPMNDSWMDDSWMDED